MSECVERRALGDEFNIGSLFGCALHRVFDNIRHHLEGLRACRARRPSCERREYAAVLTETPRSPVPPPDDELLDAVLCEGGQRLREARNRASCPAPPRHGRGAREHLAELIDMPCFFCAFSLLGEAQRARNEVAVARMGLKVKRSRDRLPYLWRKFALDAGEGFFGSAEDEALERPRAEETERVADRLPHVRSHVTVGIALEEHLLPPTPFVVWGRVCHSVEHLLEFTKEEREDPPVLPVGGDHADALVLIEEEEERTDVRTLVDARLTANRSRQRVGRECGRPRFHVGAFGKGDEERGAADDRLRRDVLIEEREELWDDVSESLAGDRAARIRSTRQEPIRLMHEVPECCEVLLAFRVRAVRVEVEARDGRLQPPVAQERLDVNL